MIKWILLGLALVGGLVGGLIAFSGGSNGGATHQAIMSSQADDSQQINADLAHNVNEEGSYYPKEPPDMMPAPAPVLGSHLISLVLLLSGVWFVRRRWNHKADANDCA